MSNPEPDFKAIANEMRAEADEFREEGTPGAIFTADGLDSAANRLDGGQ